MLTRQQLYELYYQGPGPTLDYIEALLAQLAVVLQKIFWPQLVAL